MWNPQTQPLIEETSRILDLPSDDKQCAMAVTAARSTLVQLKAKFLMLRAFQPDALLPSTPEEIETLKEEFSAIRSAFECGLLLSVKERSHEQTAIHWEQLFGIYTHPFVLKHLDQTRPSQVLATSLALLWCLAKDDLEKFHLMWYRISAGKHNFFGALKSDLTPDLNKLIDFPLLLERDLMDGNITKVLAVVATPPPHNLFQWCVDELLKTLRYRVCLAVESSYASITTDHAKKMLAFQRDEDLRNFLGSLTAQKSSLETALQKSNECVIERPSTPLSIPRAEEGKIFTSLGRDSEWFLNEGEKTIEFRETTSNKVANPVPRLLRNWLTYAERLEVL